MSDQTIRVPGSLLLDPNLSPEAKLLWIVRRVEPLGLSGTQLALRTGLSRPTVRKGLASLGDGAWGGDRDWATIPAELLLATHLDATTRLMYGILQLTPGFVTGTGRFRTAELSQLAGVDPEVVRRVIRILQASKWVYVYQANRKAPIAFRLENPPAARRAGEVVDARQRVIEATHKGEALMREYLSLLVDSDEYEDNASPAFLVNPFSDEQLEFDRYYPPKVACEFNGAQHDGPTPKFPSLAEALKQQGRDLVKAGICARRGIHLLTFRAEDLTLAGMQDKLGTLLPLRDLAQHGPLIDYLESESGAYRLECRWA